MFDKYDLLYGIRSGEKKELRLIFWSATVILVLQFVITGKISLQFTWPNNILNMFNFTTTALLVGIFAAFVVTYLRVLKSIKKFQVKKNMLLILEDDSFSREQIETVKKKALVRGEILHILSMNGLSAKTRKRINKIQRSIGGVREARAKAEYLKIIEGKFLAAEHLNKKELQYLNELILSEKDLQIYKTLTKALKIEKKRNKSA